MMVSLSIPPSLPLPRAEDVIPLDLISAAVFRASRLRTTLDEGVVMVRLRGAVREAGFGRVLRASDGIRRNMMGYVYRRVLRYLL